MPGWLQRVTVPLFVSVRRLDLRKIHPPSTCDWALDSGGFTELNMFGKWNSTPEAYAEKVATYSSCIGRLDWAAIQDWMCEPFVLEKTGKSVQEHQDLTVASYLKLRELAPELPWAPVLQGYTTEEYFACFEKYKAAGVCLSALPVVGLGSICRRQHSQDIADLAEFFSREGLKLHGFGVKKQGLKKCASFLTSADSLAWSFGARYAPALPGCSHKTCANCLDYAMLWRQEILNCINKGEENGKN